MTEKNYDTISKDYERLFPVDIEQFWRDDKLAHEQNCFSSKSPQAALGIRMSDECVFDELNESGDPWGQLPIDKRIEINKRYNDKAEKIVGMRLLREKRERYPEPDAEFPQIKDIGEVFEGKLISKSGTLWLEQACNTPSELKRILDHVDTINLRDFILPKNWDSEKKRIFNEYGIKPSLWRDVRGPVTLACSIYGTENLIFLIKDESDLAKRFSNTIAKIILEYIKIFDYEAGYEADNAPAGFGFRDDSCCFLNAEMYEQFGYPVLKKVFDYCSPEPEDTRYQHSDSEMNHLLPILGRLNLNGVNFGPTVLVDEIRKYLPNARIDGCLAPFTFSRNNFEQIISEVRRDCEMAKKSRGLNIDTAGSLNYGSLLISMRAVMHTIQIYGRY
ncbi:MAG: hypothetical protein A2Y10_06120 [Planctomycetes bacterium GWF2_41_51]|nr:MAG: hypothetical protein A2Y10_06120 [Planctomycetes bacterium GWF2_41_51]HBG26462.1 hypothetical protein [Phycisphaerales bacterium]